MIESNAISQKQVEKLLFFAAIYTLAFFAAFQVSSL